MRNANAKTKKLNLETIKIDSFVTSDKVNEVKGGGSGTLVSRLIACTMSYQPTICFNDCLY